tara:strand:- start:1 stop:822 length:822 start_codon:yes stop_codon:yes gene_type:complete
MIKVIKRSSSFGRRPKGKAGPISDLVPVDLPTASSTVHPSIHTDLAEHDFNTSIQQYITVTHNEAAFKRYGLNGLFDFPNPYHDYEVPDDLKNHINKNISVPNGKDGNNLIGKILGVKNVYIDNYGYLPFYIVLFQADAEHENAIVKLIYKEKVGIKVLGIETKDEMMARIEKANADHLANQTSVQMQILDKVAIENQKKPGRTSLFGIKKGSDSVKFNVDDSIPESDSLSRSSSSTASGKTKRRRKRTRTRRRTRRSVNKGKKTKGKKTKRR